MINKEYIKKLPLDVNLKKITINEKKKEIEKIYNSRSWRLIIILKNFLSIISFNKFYK